MSNQTLTYDQAVEGFGSSDALRTVDIVQVNVKNRSDIDNIDVSGLPVGLTVIFNIDSEGVSQTYRLSESGWAAVGGGQPVEVGTESGKSQLVSPSAGTQVIVSEEGGRIEEFLGLDYSVPESVYITKEVSSSLAVVLRAPAYDVGIRKAYSSSSGYEFDIYYDDATGEWVWVSNYNLVTYRVKSDAIHFWDADWSGMTDPNLGGPPVNMSPSYPLVLEFEDRTVVLRISEPYSTTSNPVITGVDVETGLPWDIRMVIGYWQIKENGVKVAKSALNDWQPMPWFETNWATGYPSQLLSFSTPQGSLHESAWVDVVSTYEVTIVNEGIYAGTYEIDGIVVPSGATVNVGWMTPGRHRQVKASASAKSWLCEADGDSFTSVFQVRLLDGDTDESFIYLPVLPKARAIKIVTNEG